MFLKVTKTVYKAVKYGRNIMEHDCYSSSTQHSCSLKLHRSFAWAPAFHVFEGHTPDLPPEANDVVP